MEKFIYNQNKTAELYDCQIVKNSNSIHFEQILVLQC